MLQNIDTIKHRTVKNDRIYGLDILRACAILFVIYGHAYLYLQPFISNNKYCAPFLDAVTLFFVLSGYLITFLLLLEKEKYEKINFRKFYIRRILRIWPVYYLVIVIVFLFFITGTIFLKNSTQLPYFFFYIFTISPN